MTNDLTGKVALITGGSRGIGAAIVRRLAADGADIGLTYRTGHAEAADIAAEVRELGRRALTIPADLAEPAAPDTVIRAAHDEFGRLDILVNNAGVTHWSPVAKLATDDIDRLYAVNARAPLLLMRAAADILADDGRIVNISSGVTARPLAGLALYSAVKAFLNQVTEIAAAEFAARRITVNAVAPGSTATGPFAALSEADRKRAGEAFALGRIGEPEDMAAVVAFLASTDASFVTGQVIYAAGGQQRPIQTR